MKENQHLLYTVTELMNLHRELYEISLSSRQRQASNNKPVVSSLSGFAPASVAERQRHAVHKTTTSTDNIEQTVVPSQRGGTQETDQAQVNVANNLQGVTKVKLTDKRNNKQQLHSDFKEKLLQRQKLQYCLKKKQLQKNVRNCAAYALSVLRTAELVLSPVPAVSKRRLCGASSKQSGGKLSGCLSRRGTAGVCCAASRQRQRQGTAERQHKHRSKTKARHNKAIDNFFIQIDSRLDVVLYHSSFYKTIKAARQHIIHGFIFVNNVVIREIGFIVQPGDVIRQKSSLPNTSQRLQRQDSKASTDLSLNHQLLPTTNTKAQDGDYKLFQLFTILINVNLLDLKQCFNYLKTINRKQLRFLASNRHQAAVVPLPLSPVSCLALSFSEPLSGCALPLSGTDTSGTAKRFGERQDKAQLSGSQSGKQQENLECALSDLSIEQARDGSERQDKSVVTVPQLQLKQNQMLIKPHNIEVSHTLKICVYLYTPQRVTLTNCVDLDLIIRTL